MRALSSRSSSSTSPCRIVAPRPLSDDLGHAGGHPRPDPDGCFHAAPLDELAEIWETLVLGARDYVRKSGFTTACIGLSGGVDSRSSPPSLRKRSARRMSLVC